MKKRIIEAAILYFSLLFGMLSIHFFLPPVTGEKEVPAESSPEETLAMETLETESEESTPIVEEPLPAAVPETEDESDLDGFNTESGLEAEETDEFNPDAYLRDLADTHPEITYDEEEGTAFINNHLLVTAKEDGDYSFLKQAADLLEFDIESFYGNTYVLTKDTALTKKQLQDFGALFLEFDFVETTELDEVLPIPPDQIDTYMESDAFLPETIDTEVTEESLE